jgi:hypothetical protein
MGQSDKPEALQLSDEQVNRIIQAGSVPDDQAERVASLLKRCLAEIEWWRGLPKLDRNGYRKRLSDGARYLRNAAAVFEPAERPMRRSINRLVQSRFRSFLPTALLHRLDPRTQEYRPSDRDRQSRDWIAGDHEAWSDPWRFDYCGDHGARAVRALLIGFAQGMELERQIEKSRASRGGPHGQPERNWLIHQLADVWEAVLNRRATPTVEGAFFRFVMAVFQELSWDDGVKMRIERCLRERRQAKSG